MDDILFSVPWHCGESDCPAGWHLSNYWSYDDGTYSVDSYGDGDHESIEESELPSQEEQDKAWRDYHEDCASTGADPLGEYGVMTPSIKCKFRARLEQRDDGVYVTEAYDFHLSASKPIPLRQLHPDAVEFLAITDLDTGKTECRLEEVVQGVSGADWMTPLGEQAAMIEFSLDLPDQNWTPRKAEEAVREAARQHLAPSKPKVSKKKMPKPDRLKIKRIEAVFVTPEDDPEGPHGWVAHAVLSDGTLCHPTGASGYENKKDAIAEGRRIVMTSGGPIIKPLWPKKVLGILQAKPSVSTTELSAQIIDVCLPDFFSGHATDDDHIVIQAPVSSGEAKSELIDELIQDTQQGWVDADWKAAFGANNDKLVAALSAAIDAYGGMSQITRYLEETPVDEEGPNVYCFVLLSKA